MRRTGFLLGLLGLVMFIGAVASFFTAFYNTTHEHEAGRISLQLDQGYQSASLQVDNEQQLRLAIRMQVESHSVQDVTAAGEPGFHARHRIPLLVYPKDPAGNILHTYECNIAWDACGHRSQKDAVLTSQGGSLQVTHKLNSFDVGAADSIQLEALLNKDTTYGATARDIQLIVYDKIIANTAWVVSGFVLLLLGPILFIVGLVLFILHQPAGNPATTEVAPTDTELPEVSVRNIAMAVHLSALIAWVGVPFGHIIGPLIVWLTQKDKSDFIDRAGRESLNFQLSITIYSLLAFILCFIFIGLLLLAAIFVRHITLSIIAAMRANEGRHYRYPLTIRFIR